MNIRHLLILLVVLTTGQGLRAQYQLGLRTQRRAGVAALAHNPAAAVHSRYTWDLNLVGAGIFVNNNYGYLQNFGLLDLATTDDLNFDEISDHPELNTVGYDFFAGNRDRYFTLHGYVEGPSVHIRVNKNHSFGLLTGAKTLLGIFNLPGEFSYPDYNDRLLNEPFTVSPFHGAGASYYEFGLNYAYRNPTVYGAVSFGVTAKYLAGLDAIYFANRTDFNYRKIGNDGIEGTQVDLTYALTSNQVRNFSFEGYTPEINGSGMAFDLGITYELDGDDPDLPRWRLGASILDIGWLSFSRNAERHELQSDQRVRLFTENYDDVEGAADYQRAVRRLSEAVFDDPDESLAANRFSVRLPTRMLLSADVHIGENLFANATFIKSASFGENALRRGSVMAFTPRYEHKWGALSVPVSLYQWNDPRVGLAARIGFLTIGTDHLGGLFGEQETTGADVYVSLRVHTLRQGFRPRYGWRGRRVKCFDF